MAEAGDKGRQTGQARPERGVEEAGDAAAATLTQREGAIPLLQPFGKEER